MEEKNLLVALERELVKLNIPYNVDYSGQVIKDPSRTFDSTSFIKVPNKENPKYEIYQSYVIDTKQQIIVYEPFLLFIENCSEEKAKIDFLMINEIIERLKREYIKDEKEENKND